METFFYQSREYFFLHIPKTGGSMWRHMFADVIPVTKKKHEFLQEKLDAYTFTIIRNPLDRLVSAFFYLKAGGTNEYDNQSCIKYNLRNISFNEFVEALYLDTGYYSYVHFIPMVNRIGDIKFFDRIALYDNLEKETREMYKIFHNKELEGNIPIILKSNHNVFNLYYDKKTRKMTESIYEEDICLYETIKKRQQN